MKSPQTVKVFREIGKVTRECDYGSHVLPVVSVKILTLTDETHVYNNGYEVRTLPIYADAQGRRYRQQVSIDYSNNVNYFCPDANQFWRPVYKTSLTGVLTFDKV